MARTNVANVAGIVEHDTDIVLTPFIDTASFIVDRVVAVQKDEDDEDYYTASELELIERWLAAHFYSVRDPRTVTVSIGRIMERFESEVDLNLNNTRYGQQAMMLDIAGGLAQLNRSLSSKGGGTIVCDLTWLGTPAETSEE